MNTEQQFTIADLMGDIANPDITNISPPTATDEWSLEIIDEYTKHKTPYCFLDFDNKIIKAYIPQGVIVDSNDPIKTLGLSEAIGNKSEINRLNKIINYKYNLAFQHTCSYFFYKNKMYPDVIEPQNNRFESDLTDLPICLKYSSDNKAITCKAYQAQSHCQDYDRDIRLHTVYDTNENNHDEHVKLILDVSSERYGFGNEVIKASIICIAKDGRNETVNCFSPTKLSDIGIESVYYGENYKEMFDKWLDTTLEEIQASYGDIRVNHIDTNKINQEYFTYVSIG